MSPINFNVSNGVKYYKTVNEAFAAANPRMRHIFCPAEVAQEKNLTIIETLMFITKKIAQLSDIKVEGNTAKEVLESLKTSITPKKQNEIKILSKLMDCLESYKDRGAIGEVLLKQKIRREGGEILKEMKANGAKI